MRLEWIKDNKLQRMIIDQNVIIYVDEKEINYMTWNISPNDKSPDITISEKRQHILKKHNL